MTAIRKLTGNSGEQYFPQTHTKAVVDDNGYSVESRMMAVQDVVNQAQMEIGTVPNDLAPTEGSTNWVTSGGVYNAIQVVQSNVTELGGDYINSSDLQQASQFLPHCLLATPYLTILPTHRLLAAILIQESNQMITTGSLKVHGC